MCRKSAQSLVLQFINTISNSTLRIGSALADSQEKVELSLPFFIEGQCFRLIDTPGFDEVTKSDTDVLNTIASWLASECAPSIPHLLIVS
jgi:hypothetical protein